MAYGLLLLIKNSVALQQFITTNIEKAYQIFVDKIFHINNTLTIQVQNFTVKKDTS